jgi:hypothetical protein
VVHGATSRGMEVGIKLVAPVKTATPLPAKKKK